MIRISETTQVTHLPQFAPANATYEHGSTSGSTHQPDQQFQMEGTTKLVNIFPQFSSLMFNFL